MSDFSISIEDSERMEREERYRKRYEKRIAELEKQVLTLRRENECWVDPNTWDLRPVYTPPVFRYDEELECRVVVSPHDNL